MKNNTALRIVQLIVFFAGIFTIGTGRVVAQDFEWAVQFEGNGNNFGTSVTADISGNVYSTGYFFDEIDLDPGAGTDIHTTPSANQDIYVSKVDENGDFVWGFTLSSIGRNRPNAIVSDDNGNIYISGYFEDEVNFDPNGSFNVTSSAVRDIFIAKYDTDANLIWIHQFESPGYSEGVSIALDFLQNNVLSTGLFGGTTNFDPGVSDTELTTEGGLDAYVAVLDIDGNFQWVRQIGSPSNDIGYSIAADKQGNVYSTGFFEGTCEFNFDGASTTLISEGGRDIYIVKHNVNGDFEWVKHFGGDLEGRSQGIVADDFGNVYCTGMFTQEFNFDTDDSNNIFTGTGPRSYFVSKMLSSNGDIEWVYPFSSAGTDWAYDIRVDNIGRVYVTGAFEGTIDFDPGVGTNEITADSRDGFIQVFDENGELESVFTYSDNGNTVPFWIHVDKVWNINSTGFFNNTTQFDPQSGTALFNSSSGNDGFTVKFDGNCTPPDAPTLTPVSSDICPNTNAVIDITTGDLNDATDWVWYDDILFTNQVGTGTQLNITLTDTTTFYVRGEGACVVGTSEVTINVGDVTPPVITTAPTTLDVETGACYFISENLPLPVVTDDCAVDTVFNDAPLLLFQGTHTITWTAIDESGNMAQETQEVTIEDNEDPEIDAPADITVSADVNCEAIGVVLGTPLAVDNCSVESITNDAPATFPIGQTIVTWTAADPAGNSATDQQVITVVDDTDPIIVGMPTDINVSNDPGDCGAIVSWTAPTVNDNCPGAVVNQTTGPANGTLFPVGVTVVEYTATDAAGNQVSATFTVTVTDDENPTITPPTDVTVSANNFCTAMNVALGTPTTNDNCGVASVTNDAPSIYALGTTVVTWTVTDDNGNQTTATQEVTVVDDQNPTIIAPADITVNVDPGTCEGTVGDLGTPITGDNCSVANVSNDAPATFPVGTTTVTWTVEDGSGNVATDVQEITVIDNIDPVILDLPNDTIVSNDTLLCSAEYTWTEPSADDNCPGFTITQTSGIANGDAFPVGVNVVEYTATDAAGNSVSATFTVTVIDDELPIITAPADTLIEANHFCTAINVTLDNPITDDNCGVISVTNDAPVIFELDTTIVTWTVTDAAGNMATATQIVVVADSTAPVVIAPLPVTAYVDENCEIVGDSIDLSWPNATDNCAVDTIYNDLPDTLTTGTYTVTWFAEDAAGNIGTATQMLTIKDTIPPTPVLMDTVITLSPDGPIVVFGEDIDLGSFDNCGVAEVILEQEVFDCDDLGVNTIGVRVIDVNGNVTDTSIVVEVLESGIDLDFDGIDDACDDDVNTTVVVVPSGFTPNGDGINDLFVITALSNFDQVELYVYNRYGNLVYESQQYENDWDGTSSKNGMDLPDGTYYYVLKLDGQAERNGYVYINRTL